MMTSFVPYCFLLSGTGKTQGTSNFIVETAGHINAMHVKLKSSYSFLQCWPVLNIITVKLFFELLFFLGHCVVIGRLYVVTFSLRSSMIMRSAVVTSRTKFRRRRIWTRPTRLICVHCSSSCMQIYCWPRLKSFCQSSVKEGTKSCKLQRVQNLERIFARRTLVVVAKSSP